MNSNDLRNAHAISRGQAISIQHALAGDVGKAWDLNNVTKIARPKADIDRNLVDSINVIFLPTAW